jgi:small GTP-binding protein domain
MGSEPSKVEEIKMVIHGFESAGKTSLLYKMKGTPMPKKSAAVISNCETFKHNNVEFTVWSIGGDRTGKLWMQYTKNCQVFIYVVDSTDTSSFEASKLEIIKAGKMEDLKNSLFVIFANKQDLPGALRASQIAEALDLPRIIEKRWNIFETSAKTSEGIVQALNWVIEELQKPQ